MARIEARLDGVEAEHGVRILWAVESGSRAWGFPSPDSDYDCRFLYVRPRADYMSLWRPRDVIETPMDAVLDVNGWDLMKAIVLAVGSNATVSEWLRSPLVYRGQEDFAAQMSALCTRLVDPARVRSHYVHVGRAHWERSGAGRGEPVALKKLLYAVRPAAALRWMRLHDCPTPPMDLPTLLQQAPPQADALTAINELVAAKAVTRELGTVVSFIQAP